MPTPLTPEQLQEHLAELEARATAAGLPPFADLMIPSGKRQEERYETENAAYRHRIM